MQRTLIEEKTFLKGLIQAANRVWNENHRAAFMAAIRFCKKRIALLEAERN